MSDDAHEPLLSPSLHTRSSSVTRRMPQHSTSSHSSPGAAETPIETSSASIHSDVELTSTPINRRFTLNSVLIRTEAIPIKRKILLLVLSGTVLGSILPKDENLSTIFVKYVSAIIGYIYFLCWSVSFYPQVIMNHTRKSTSGLSADFSILNVFGFACYSIYTTSFYFSATIRKEYEDRNDDGNNSVQSNDVAFAIHAFLLSSIQMLQIIRYDAQFSWKSLSIWTRYFLLFSSALCFSFAGLVLHSVGGSSNEFQWIDFLYMLSSLKLAISIIKYIPQVLMNYQRKSTVGWNVWNVLLDCTGGILSLIQLVIDALDMHDFSAITGNWVKFGLSLVSILFDIVFIVQHYILYPHHNADGSAVEAPV